MKGYRVRHTTNIVDLTDKTIAEAERAGLDHGAFTKRALGEFLRETATLRISEDVVTLSAQESVETMLGIVEKLVEKGYAYEKFAPSTSTSRSSRTTESSPTWIRVR